MPVANGPAPHALRAYRLGRKETQSSEIVGAFVTTEPHSKEQATMGHLEMGDAFSAALNAQQWDSVASYLADDFMWTGGSAGTQTSRDSSPRRRRGSRLCRTIG